MAQALRPGRHLTLCVVWLLVACGAEPGIEDAFLWRLDAVNAPTYLFGTIHIGIEAEELPRTVWDAFNSSSIFVAESDVAQVPSAEELDEAARLPADVTLQQLLAPEAWERLRLVLPDTPEEMLRRTHPWVVEAVLQRSLLPEQMSMDEAFTLRAREAGKSVEFFETFGDFGDVLRALPLQQSAQSLEALLGDPRGFVAAVDQLAALYQGGDARAVRLALYGDADDPQTSAQDKSLLKDRNDAWFPGLQRLVQGGGAFVAVGLAHLIGPDNLLDSLASKGFESVRIGSSGDARGIARAAQSLSVGPTIRVALGSL